MFAKIHGCNDDSCGGMVRVSCIGCIWVDKQVHFSNGKVKMETMHPLDISIVFPPAGKERRRKEKRRKEERRNVWLL